MKTVNLLPAWYLTQRRRQRHLRLHAIAMILVGAAMIGTVAVARQRLASLSRQRDDLARRLLQVGDPESQLDLQKADLRRLQDLRSARQELGPTVPMSSVIQQLQNDLTPGIALSSVNVDVRNDPVKGSGVVGDAQKPPRYHNVAHICVGGVAPNEIQITQLVQRISKNPLFGDVTLNFIRTGTLQGYSVRRFEIQLSMDMERLPTDPVAVSVLPPPESPLASGEPTHGQ